jgi:hypothetical protein
LEAVVSDLRYEVGGGAELLLPPELEENVWLEPEV